MRIHLYSLLTVLAISSGNIAANTNQPPIPIVLVEGGIATEYDMEPTIQFIRKHLGDDIYIKKIQPLSGMISSVGNLYNQAEHLRNAIETDPFLRNGFNMITHSQGGLVARYYIERYNNPHVLTYIAYGTPQQGVFGTPGTLDDHFKWLDALEENAHNIMYSWSFQKFVSFAGYWHDTIHYEKYLKKSCFLPYLNNEFDHEYASLFKYNICKLRNMVLIMSVHEQVVEPSISCHFGFYKKGSKSQIEEMVDTEIYQQDTLGLKSLHQIGRLHLRFANCPHALFQEDEKNFVENALPFLMPDTLSDPPIPPTEPRENNDAFK